MTSNMTIFSIHLETPPQVELRTSSVDSTRLGIWCKEIIFADQMFGPYLGEKTASVTEDMDTTFMWEVVDEKTQQVLYYIDATKPERGNWMRCINCAACFEKQNIVLQQINGEIFYKAIKDINPGEELLTWYSKSSFKYKTTPRRSKRGRKPSRHLEQSSLPKKQLHLDASLGFTEPVKQSINTDNIKTESFQEETQHNQKLIAEDLTYNVSEEKCNIHVNEVKLKDVNNEENQDKINCKSIHIEILSEPVKDEPESDICSSPGSLKIDESRIESNIIKDIDSSKGNIETKPGEFQFELKNHHVVKGRVGRKVFRCDICSGVYRHAFSLKRHFLRTHINYRYLSATDISNCNINVNSQEMALHNLEAIKKESLPTISLPNNTESTNNENEENDASLAQAVQEFEVSKNKLDVKIEKKDSRIKFFCQNKNNLPELYRCHICSAFFDRLYELKNHISNHPQLPSTKSFACSQCDMTFSHKQNLVRHLSVHSGEKPYSCKFCGRCFPTVTNQRRHERIHMGLKPFACQHCSSVFTQSGDLKKHVRRQHKENFHPCAFCTKYFGTVGLLEEHLLKHGETPESNEKTLVKQHVSAKLEQKPVMADQAVVKIKTASKSRNTCNICFKIFSTFHNLCRHQRHVHQNNNKSRFALDNTETTRSNISIQKSEDCFMENVSQNILENFLHYLDGKIEQIQINSKHDGDRVSEEAYVPENLEWTKYNFPTDFEIEANFANIASRCFKTSPNPEMAHQNNILEEPQNLEKSTLTDSPSKIDGYSCEICLGIFKSFIKFEKHMKAKHKRKISPKKGKNHEDCEEISDILDEYSDTTYICCVCKDSFIHIIDFEIHQQQMHPHVDCTYIELENFNGPIVIPPEFWLQFCDPVGFLSQSSLPVTTLSQHPGNFTCTKCGEICHSMEALHSHILDCADSPKPLAPILPSNKKRTHPPGRRLTKKGLKRKRRLSIDTPPRKRTPEKKEKNYLVNKEKKQLNFDDVPFHQTRQDHLILQKIKLMCDNCNKSFNYGSALERHSKMCPLREKVHHHNGPSIGVRQKEILQQHSCPYCQRSFTYLASLRKHIHDFCPKRIKPDDITSSENSSQSSEIDLKEYDSKLEDISSTPEPKPIKLIHPVVKKSPRGRPPGKKNKSVVPIIQSEKSAGNLKKKERSFENKQDISISKSLKSSKSPKKYEEINSSKSPRKCEELNSTDISSSAITNLSRMLNALKTP